MVDATSSRVRMRVLTGLGRRRSVRGGVAAAPSPSASRRRTGADGAAIAPGTPPRPSAVRPRPEVGESWHQPSGHVAFRLATLSEGGFVLTEVLPAAEE